jgi:SpoIID/LytB domain protein
MKRIGLPILVVSLLLLSTIVSNIEAKAATVSVQLVNYLGNQTSVNFNVDGTYKLANNNTRISGKDRFEVAYNVATQGWKQADTVVVVNYLAFADALSATPLAVKSNAPILLTEPNNLNDFTAKKIKELGASKVYIVGGVGSVSQNVENQLKNIVGNNVERINGRDRYEVAKNVSLKMGPTTSAILANGLVFSDALAIAPYAAKAGIPILLTKKDALEPSTEQALADKTNVLIVGGPPSVSDDILNKLNQKMPNQVRRIGGADRYEVSANILKDPKLGLNPDTVYLSSGETFADALTGSVLAAQHGAPLLLTNGTELPSVIKQTLIDSDTSIVNILGGTPSVSVNVEKSLPNELYLDPGSTYSAKLVNGDLQLTKGSTLIKDFGSSSFTLDTTYSTSNRLNILSGTPRTYLGDFEFDKVGNYVKPMNLNIPIEDYLKGVVPREMPASWNEEALKAQAVAARTFVEKYNVPINDSQSYQVYGGYYNDPTYGDKINRVVDSTKDKVLRSYGKLITAFFTSSNGGMTLSNKNTYGTDLVPYLTTKVDKYDAAVSSDWNFTLNKTQISLANLDLTNPGAWWGTVKEADTTITSNIKSWLSNTAYINPKYEIKIIEIPTLSFTTSFTVNDELMGNMTLKYLMRDKTNGSYIMDDNNNIKVNTATLSKRAYDLRSIIGSTIMKSPYVKNIASTPVAYAITGGGYGHGLGMSQFGANEMARQKFTYAQILNFYYPGTTLGN